MSTTLIVALIGLAILAAGFLIGRYYLPDDRLLRRQARRADVYIRTVNHLLIDDHDAALDAAMGELRELVRSENVEDIEPYFALGALFRRKGQWERAVRVHQAVWLREGQNKKIRLRAEYELGLDFQHAGMPRKAIRAMEKCLEQDSKHEGALWALSRLYEEQGRYAEAADAMLRLARLQDGDVPERHHHLLVAASQRALHQGDMDSARRLLREAQRGERVSAHALVASAELALARDNAKGATAQLERALGTAPELAHVLVPGLLRAQRELAAAQWEKDGKKEGAPRGEQAEAMLDERAAHMTVAVLERVLHTLGRSGHLELAIAELRSHHDPRAAIADYDRIGDEFPELLPARVAAARLALARNDSDDIKAELHALAAADGVLSWATEGSWRCGQCGKRDEAFFWRCRHCRSWGTVRLDVGRDALDVPLRSLARAQRELPRGGVSVALLGAVSEHALPEPALDSGLGDPELHEAGRRPSVLGRVGGWFTDTWTGLRASKRKSAPESAVPALPAPGQSSAHAARAGVAAAAGAPGAGAPGAEGNAAARRAAAGAVHAASGTLAARSESAGKAAQPASPARSESAGKAAQPASPARSESAGKAAQPASPAGQAAKSRPGIEREPR
jgi:lipopolysaccharide assembly protein B